MTLGDAIKTYREEHGISLRAFARLTGLSPTYISYLEKGQTQRGNKPIASIETYRVVAKAMGKDIDEFIREVDDVVSVNSHPKEKDAETGPNIRTAKKIADSLGVPLATLSGNNEISEDELNYALMQKMSELRPEEVEKVLLFIQGLVAGRKD